MARFKRLFAILVVASVAFVAEAMAQTQAPAAGQEQQEKTIQGQVKSIDPAGKELTLTDGTRLLAPQGAAIRPGALAEGMTVIASYREENGENVLTELAVEQPASASPPDQRSPAAPPTAPRRDSPKR